MLAAFWSCMVGPKPSHKPTLTQDMLHCRPKCMLGNKTLVRHVGWLVPDLDLGTLHLALVQYLAISA